MVGGGRPVVALPVDGVLGLLGGHALPPHVAVVGQRRVGEDRVALDGDHRLRVGLIARAGRDAEEAGLGVDRVEAPVVAELHPGDVVADGLDRPALERRDEHREVRLAGGRRERAGDVLHPTLRRGELEDEHVLGHPALVAGHDRGDPQRQALLAQQRVAAVARAVGPDLAGLGVVDDVLRLGVGRPRDVVGAIGERGADRVHARDEVAVGAEVLEGAGAHAGHDPHVDHDVGRVGDLDPDMGLVRPQRPHGERHDVHRAVLHGAVEELAHLGAHRGRVAPVVRRPGVALVLRADVGAVLDAGHVGGFRPSEVAVGALGLIEALEGAGVDELLAERLVLLGRPVAPVDARGLGQGGDLLDPGLQLLVGGGGVGGHL